MTGARRVVVLVLAGLVAAATGARGQARPPAARTIAFVSDTQAPLPREKARAPGERNEEATARILDRIGGEPDLAAVLMLGDVTVAGSVDAGWPVVDRFLARLRTRGVPVAAALGNHDYWYAAPAALANFRRRFPTSTAPVHTTAVGPVTVVVLNSQLDALAPAEQRQQLAAYEAALARADADASVRAVLVACHNPPYTNSLVVEPSPVVRERFVPPFLRARKGRLFLSGHAHAAEHFVVDGRHLVVLGGGGGPRHPLRTAGRRYVADLFPDRSPRRPFHYLTVRLEATRLAVAFQALRGDLSGFEPVGSFTVAY